jgi:hypothetical protein
MGAGQSGEIDSDPHESSLGELPGPFAALWSQGPGVRGCPGSLWRQCTPCFIEIRAVVARRGAGTQRGPQLAGGARVPLAGGARVTLAGGARVVSFLLAPPTMYCVCNNIVLCCVVL